VAVIESRCFGAGIYQEIVMICVESYCRDVEIFLC
jgi:hypothetical protein